jgi:ABC-2 type transport system ATP-binding protein
MSIVLKNITKTFTERNWRTALLRKAPRTTRALADISLSVKPGEIFGLLGPNGAGKTTLIKILATLILPDSGRAKVCGRDLISRPKQVRSEIGVVNTGERSFYWRLSGRQNLDFFASMWNLSGARRSQRVEEMLSLVGLSEKADTAFMKYSSGQQQRLSLARALLPDPSVLLMDEPTRGLDPNAAADLIGLAKNRLATEQSKTILWCTHNMQEAQTICDRLAILHKGKVATAGTLKEIQALIDNRGVCRIRINICPEATLAKADLPITRTIRNNGHLEIEIRENEQHMPDILKELVDRQIKVYSCIHKQPDLEDIFEQLTDYS